MATPLLPPGARVTHSGELIRRVVTLSMLPLGAFEDDTVRVCVVVCAYACVSCKRVCVCEDNLLFLAVDYRQISIFNPISYKTTGISKLQRVNFISHTHTHTGPAPPYL